MIQRTQLFIITMFCFLVVFLCAYDMFALPVRYHKWTGGTIVLQMKPFSVPSGVVQDAKILASIRNAKFNYMIAWIDVTGKVVDVQFINKYSAAENLYLVKVKKETKVELSVLKPGKTKLKDGKVENTKPTEVKALVIEP